MEEVELNEKDAGNTIPFRTSFEGELKILNNPMFRDGQLVLPGD